ncbi:MAG: nicotinate-nucleotide--dimethylbenzimidazole phosphoribosyltransferase [Selenomonadaceae bacterium]|nr:nicotinate-nucleotide--dimethylbenzimidazole phosphoribosyltransferase [Selenomonadaceae bacterium]
MTFEQVENRYKRIGKAKKCTFIFCADNGVTEEKVSAYPKATTVGMVKNYLVTEGAAANVFANFASSEMYVVDVGVDADLSQVPKLIGRKIRRGTNNIARESAMTSEEANKSIEIGMDLTMKAIAAGFNCFLIGEMGIGNTTAAAAMTAAYLNLPPEEVTGRGTNIDDEKLQHKIEVVRRALEVNEPDAKKQLDVFTKLGGYEFGAMAGVILAAHEKNCVVILDGFNSSVAALIAEEINPKIGESLIASHIGREKGHRAILEHLGLNPLLKLDLALGEAIGSSIVARMLDDYSSDDNFDCSIEKFSNDDSEVEFQLSEQRLESVELQKYPLTIRLMGEEVEATDKTFNFYLQTMPELYPQAMKNCRAILDSLTKPKKSLGYLEDIAVQIAGIANEDFPTNNLGHALLSFGTDENSPVSGGTLGTKRYLGLVTEDANTKVAFNFGRNLAEEITFDTPILTITNSAEFEALGEILSATALKADGTLSYKAEEFLTYVPEKYLGMTGALIGALVGAAHNSCLIIADMSAVEIITRYIEELCPQIRPFILHCSRLMAYKECTSLADVIAEAALAALNEMKTFEETGVDKAF